MTLEGGNFYPPHIEVNVSEKINEVEGLKGIYLSFI